VSGLRPNLNATAADQQVSVANGRMDGFVQAQTTPHTNGKGAMGYYLPADLPVMTQLADQGVLFDHWFSSVPGGTIANRLFAVSGAAVPDTDQVPAAGWPDLPVIFDRLQAAGVSWKVYVEHYEPALTIKTAGPKARRGGQVARVPLLALNPVREERRPGFACRRPRHLLLRSGDGGDARGFLDRHDFLERARAGRTTVGSARGTQRGQRPRRELCVAELGVPSEATTPLEAGTTMSRHPLSKVPSSGCGCRPC